MIDQALFSAIVKDTAAIAAPLLVTAVMAILTKLLQKLHLDVTAQQEARLRYFAERAIQAVQETVTAAGPEKLAAATALVQQQYPKLPVEDIMQVIHAELARQRGDAGNLLFQPKAAS